VARANKTLEARRITDGFLSSPAGNVGVVRRSVNASIFGAHGDGGSENYTSDQYSRLIGSEGACAEDGVSFRYGTAVAPRIPKERATRLELWLHRLRC